MVAIFGGGWAGFDDCCCMLAILRSPFGSPGCPAEAEGEVEEDPEAAPPRSPPLYLLPLSGEVGMLRTGSVTFLEECDDLDVAAGVDEVCLCCKKGSR